MCNTNTIPNIKVTEYVTLVTRRLVDMNYEV